MNEIDLSRPSREVGSMLSGEEVERLREAIGWLRGQRGVRLKEIARGCDAAEHTVRNFAYRKSVRPDNAFLGKLYRFIAGERNVLPDGALSIAGNTRSQARGEIGRLGCFDLVRMEMPISKDDLQRIFDRYSGYYLCFRRSYRPEMMSVSWLHILPLGPNVDMANDGMPLPRFTLFIGYPDQLDPNTAHSNIIGGYAIRRNGRIFLIGQRDGELKYFTLKEPQNRKFTYIQGLCLLTSADDSEPFSTRVVCQYLGKRVAREDWEDKIGMFREEVFGGVFDNADVVMRAIGEESILVGDHPV